MSSWSRRFVDTGWLWRGPGLVVVAILALTSVVALVQQQEAVRRRDLVFAAQAGQVRQEILEAIDREGERFRTAVDHVAVTHPAPIGQFRTYFDRQSSGVGREPQSSYNFIVLEQVAPVDFAALREREARLGDTDFRVRSVATGTEPRILITRTAAPVAEGFDVTGLDVTGLQDQMPIRTPDVGYTLQVLETGPTLGLLLRSAGRTADEVRQDVEQITTFAMLVSPIDTLAPNQVASAAVAARLVPMAELFDPVDLEVVDGVQASLRVDGFDGPLATIVGPGGAPSGPVDLRADFDLFTEGQRWGLVITADSSYGPPVGLFDNLGTWTFGVTTAALAALALMARGWHSRRLVRAERELASALTVASTDGLTGLLNRIGFLQQSSRLEVSQPATVMFIDLDGFKSINDLDGHEAGDRVLRKVAEGLTGATRPSDLVSRMGGDEFIVYLRQTASEQIAAQLASRLIDIVDQIDERISCSIGVALRHPGEVTVVDELLRRADAAMYKVKRSGGRGYHIVRSGPRVAEGAGRPGIDGPDRQPVAPSGDLLR